MTCRVLMAPPKSKHFLSSNSVSVQLVALHRQRRAALSRLSIVFRLIAQQQA